MKILITGSAGFIGSHLAEKLSDRGHDVIGIDSLTDYYSIEQKKLNLHYIQSKGVRFIPMDIARDDLDDVVSSADFIYHLSAQPGISSTTSFDSYLRNNIIATKRLLDSAQKSDRLTGFVNISTSSIYGALATGDETTEPKPQSNYGVTKLAAEQLVMSYAREKDFPACSMRLFSVYGPRERPEKLYPRLIGSILDRKPFPLCEGSRTHIRSFSFIDDITDGLASALTHFEKCKGEIFNIGTDVAITTEEGIHLIEEIIGAKAIFRDVLKRPGDQLRTQANIEKARRILGYNPKTPASEGLAREVEWYRDNIHGKIDLWKR